MKKTLFLLMACVAALSLVSCGGKSFLGTYEVEDKKGETFLITLNKDKTATIEEEGTAGETWYGSWEDGRKEEMGIVVNIVSDLAGSFLSSAMSAAGSLLSVDEASLPDLPDVPTILFRGGCKPAPRWCLHQGRVGVQRPSEC